MSESRVLLDRIFAFRQRLDEDAPDATPVSFERTVAPPVVSEGPPQSPLTDRARGLVKDAHALLARQKAFTADPLVAGLPADPLAAYHRESVALMNSAVQLLQALPVSPSVQLKLCDGLEGVLDILRGRHRIQDRALAQRKADALRVDRLAAVYTALHRRQIVTLKPLAAMAEELLEDARQGKPLRFLEVSPDSTSAIPGGPGLPAPARFAAAHALNTAQVVARVVGHDFEWAARPLLPVVAALLADCGMLGVPADILAKAGPLTANEKRQVEAHPRYGAELVTAYLADSAPLAGAIAAHHERIDGTGYPAGLRGAAVPPLARLLAAAGTYAALCVARPHRPAFDTRAALTEVLLQAERGVLDKDFAEYLVHLAFYPAGTVVELTDGRVGIVAANHPGRVDLRSPTRPVVAVLLDADGTPLARPDHLDLSAADRGGILRSLPADRRRELLGTHFPDLV